MIHDIRFALRALRRTPGFAAAVILTLAAGIGGTTAMYGALASMVGGLPPIPNPDATARVWAVNNGIGVERGLVSPGELDEWRRRTRSWQALAGFDEDSCQFEVGNTSTKVALQRATPAYFDAAGVSPRLGRLTAPDSSMASEPVVILSHRLWQRAMGGDPGALGRWVTLCGEPRQVLGVMPEGFYFPATEAEAWIPLGAGTVAKGRFLAVAGRLRSGVTWAQAQAEMDLLAKGLDSTDPQGRPGWAVRVTPLPEEASHKLLLGTIALLGPALLVLLVVSVNVGNLLLARAAGREREIALRLALGARRGRILRQLLTECLLLAAPAGLLGLLFASGASAVLRSAAAAFNPDLAQRLGQEFATLLAPALLLTVVTPLFFGLAPALVSLKVDLARALRAGGGRRLLLGFGGYQGRDLLVIAEVGVAAGLVAFTGLLICFFAAVLPADPGLDLRRLTVVRLSLVGAGSGTNPPTTDLPRQVLDRVRGLAGVEGVSLAELSKSGRAGNPASSLAIEDRPAGCSAPELRIDRASVGVEYFETVGVPIRRGAPWRRRDAVAVASEVVVSQSLARSCWPGADPVGKRLKWGGRDSSEPWRTVIGVAGDVRIHMGASPAQIYEPSVPASGENLTVWLRTAPNAVVDPASLHRVLREADLRLQVAAVERLQDLLARQRAEPAFMVRLLGAFGALALGLATVGVYSVLSHAVAQRTREIGIRMALGATPGAILRLVIGRGMTLVLVGLLAGSAVTVAIAMTTGREFLRVSGADPLLWAPVLMLLSGAGLLASWIPARRAAGVDPMVAIREE